MALGPPSLGIKSKSARQVARHEPSGRLGGFAALFMPGPALCPVPAFNRSLHPRGAEEVGHSPRPIFQDKRTAQLGGVSAHTESLLAKGVWNPALRKGRQRLVRSISRSGGDPSDPNLESVPQ